MKVYVDLAIELLRNLAVVVVVAYLVTRTRLFNAVLARNLRTLDKLLLILIFGLFSIFGTMSGIELLGVVANIRDLGPALAGLVGGPLVGLCAGLVGAIYRMSIGGFTVVGCSVSTVLAGLAGGLIYKYRKGRFLNVWQAVVFAALMETAHMGIVLATARPFSKAWEVVKGVWVPMMIANALGIAVFALIISNLVKEQKLRTARERMEGELNAARDIQMTMVPKMFPAFPDRPEFDIYAILEPAKEVGGDLYNFFFLDDDHLCFLVGDVSGKGVPASLMMAVTRTLVEAKAAAGMSPAAILAAVNRELCRDNDSCMFVTMFLGILDVPTGQVVYSNAGHNLPYVCRAGGAVEEIPRSVGVALGVMENVPFAAADTYLDPDDSFFLFTDGVTEAMDKDGRWFDNPRLRDALESANGSSPREVIGNVLERITVFVAGAEPSDDITMLVLRRSGLATTT
jgi:sigma-B regulation protein RsbU (phosphoserine phosphatase)